MIKRMWNVIPVNNLQMAEGDFGIELPVEIKGTTIGPAETLRFTFKDKVNGTVIMEKDFAPVTDNTVNLVLSEEESALFPVGQYVYSLDWYSNGVFLCNILPVASFKVVDKA